MPHNTSNPILTFSQLSKIWANGTVCFENISGSISAPRTALIGDNGSGKTTLLKILAGKEKPTSGVVTGPRKIAYLPQNLGLHPETSLAELFGMSTVLDALDSLAAGNFTEEIYEAIGEQWDIAEKAHAHLTAAGFKPAVDAQSRTDFDAPTFMRRKLGQLSGGEAVQAALIALLRDTPSFLFLDEPTNNLDTLGREVVYELMKDPPCPVLVISHDQQLLALVDTTIEIYRGSLRAFTGNYHDYLQAIASEQDAAERNLRQAKQEERKQKREQIEAETKLAHSARQASGFRDKKRASAMEMGLAASAAQKSAAKLRAVHSARLASARVDLQASRDALRESSEIYLDLPGSELPVGRRVLHLTLRDSYVPGLPETLSIQGPERVRLKGANGSGKTTLLEEIAGRRCTGQSLYACDFVTEKLGYIPQQLDPVEHMSVLELVAQANPTLTEQEIRDQLARLLFRRDRVHLPASVLSGGEQLRVALAKVLLAAPSPQLLLLDEPSNNLDMNSVAWLISALKNYRGALLVVSHDETFCAALGFERDLELARA